MTDKEYIEYAKQLIEKLKARNMVLESDIKSQERMLKENKNKFKEYERVIEELKTENIKLKRKLGDMKYEWKIIKNTNNIKSTKKSKE